MFQFQFEDSPIDFYYKLLVKCLVTRGTFRVDNNQGKLFKWKKNDQTIISQIRNVT